MSVTSEVLRSAWCTALAGRALWKCVMQPRTYWLQVIEGVTRVLGRAIWTGAAIGLTHGRLTSLPGGMAYRACHVLVSQPCSVQAGGRICRVLYSISSASSC